MSKKTATNAATAKGPNKHPEAQTEKQIKALEVTCRYLGKVFYEGDRVCYRGKEWECSGGSWVATGRNC